MRRDRVCREDGRHWPEFRGAIAAHLSSEYRARGTSSAALESLYTEHASSSSPTADCCRCCDAYAEQAGRMARWAVLRADFTWLSET